MTWEQNRKPEMGISPYYLAGPEQVDFAGLCTALGATGLEDCKEILPHFAAEIDAINQQEMHQPSASDSEAA